MMMKLLPSLKSCWYDQIRRREILIEFSCFQPPRWVAAAPCRDLPRFFLLSQLETSHDSITTQHEIEKGCCDAMENIYIHFSTRYIVIVESFSLLSDRKRLNATNERTVCVVSCHGMGSALSAAASRARKIVVTFLSVNNRHFHQFVSDRGWLTLTQPDDCVGWWWHPTLLFWPF